MTFKRMLGAVALAVISSTAVTHTAKAATELRILAWDGYADKDWIAEFDKQNNADVKVVFAQTDDEIWSKIKGSDGTDFDLFAVNTAELQRYIAAKLAVPYDLSKLPNHKDALPQFQDLTAVPGLSRDGKVYGIPFAFDTIGIIYDTNKVKTPPTTMNVMWDPQYKGRILAYDASAHNFSWAALASGIKTPFNLTDDQLAMLKTRLIKLQSNVLSYYQTSDEALKIYQDNDVALIFANFGHQQLKLMQAAGAPVKYVVPEEGGLSWLDTWALSKGARHPDLAEAWVNFVIQKRISNELSERQGFGNTTTALATANPHDKPIYLLPVENPQKRSDLWNEVRAAAN